MGRGRVQLRMIENKINRQVTFSKRRSGLMKKASELSILCDAEVAMIVFSNTGKLYEFSSSSMTKILERHRKCSTLVEDISKDPQDSNTELTELKRKTDNLQRWRRHVMGEDLDQLSVKELQQLEQQLEEGLKQVKLKKEQQLEGAKKSLHKKVGGKLRPSILSLFFQRYESWNSLFAKTSNDETWFLRHTMAMWKQQLQLSELRGKYPCDQYPIPISGSSWHSTAGNYNTHVLSRHCEPTLHIGCPSGSTGNHIPGHMQSGNYDGR